VIDMLKRQKQHMIAQSTRGTSSQAQGSVRQSDGLNVAQGLALHRDADGDISMDGAMDGAKAEHDHGVDRSEDNPGIDTSWLDDDNIDLIAQTVEDFRGQRLSMVQSLRQFVLCYETVLEWISRVRQSDSGVLDTRGRGRSGSLTL
jgi:protein-tyrosine phosphatase